MVRYICRLKARSAVTSIGPTLVGAIIAARSHIRKRSARWTEACYCSRILRCRRERTPRILPPPRGTEARQAMCSRGELIATSRRSAHRRKDRHRPEDDQTCCLMSRRAESVARARWTGVARDVDDHTMLSNGCGHSAPVAGKIEATGLGEAVICMAAEALAPRRGSPDSGVSRSSRRLRQVTSEANGRWFGRGGPLIRVQSNAGRQPASYTHTQ